MRLAVQASAALCVSLLVCRAAVADDFYYDIRVHIHPDVYIGIYNDGRLTWNALPLPSRVALEAKLLSASQEHPRPLLAVVPHGRGSQKFNFTASLFRKYGFLIVPVLKPAAD